MFSKNLSLIEYDFCGKIFKIKLIEDCSGIYENVSKKIQKFFNKGCYKLILIHDCQASAISYVDNKYRFYDSHGYNEYKVARFALFKSKCSLFEYLNKKVSNSNFEVTGLEFEYSTNKVSETSVVENVSVPRSKSLHSGNSATSTVFRKYPNDCDLQKITLSTVNRNSDQFMSQIAALYGMDVVKVAGDGSCFYHAIAHQLKRLGLTPHDYQTIRDMTADYLENHPDRHKFVEFCVGDANEETRLQHILHGIRNNEWANHATILCTADVLNINIDIITNTAPYRPWPIRPRKGASQHTATICLRGEMHYDALMPILSVPRSKSPHIENSVSSTIVSPDKSPSKEKSTPCLICKKSDGHTTECKKL